MLKRVNTKIDALLESSDELRSNNVNSSKARVKREHYNKKQSNIQSFNNSAENDVYSGE